MAKRDPGLQPERTALAWRRTALAIFVNGALLVRAAVEAQSPLLAVVSVLILASALATAAVGSHRRTALIYGVVHQAPHAAAARFVLGATVLVAVAALLSFVT